MKMTIGMAFLCAGVLLAQDAGEKTTVPLKDPSRPAVINAHLMAGGITVRGADVKDVSVEAHMRSHESHESRDVHADGMRRLELPGNAGLEVEEDDNVVSIRTAHLNRPTDLVITVPRHSSLQLKCTNDGDIYVEQVDGEIEVNNLNGRVTLKNVAGSVIAHSLNGEVLATLDPRDYAATVASAEAALLRDTAHCHNLETRRHELWNRLDRWITSLPIS